MKKFSLFLLSLTLTICGCDNKKDEEKTNPTQEVQSVINVEKKLLSTEEKKKLVKERYEDFNTKTLELYKFYFDMIEANLPYPSPFNKDNFKTQIDFKETNANEIEVKISFKYINEQNKIEEIPITIDDKITFNEELEKQGILAQLERRINFNDEQIRKNHYDEETYEKINDIRAIHGIIYGGYFTTFYEDGRNSARYMIAPYSNSRKKNDILVHKFKFNGAELYLDYLQKDLANPFLIGNAQWNFRGFDILTDNGTFYLEIKPYSAKYSYNKEGIFNIELNNLSFLFRGNNKNFNIDYGKVKFSTKFAKVPDSIMDIYRIYLPRANTKFELNNLAVEHNGIKFIVDNIAYADNSIIREKDFDLKYQSSYEFKQGIMSIAREIMEKAEGKDTLELDKKLPRDIDFYKFSSSLNIPNLDLAIVNNIETCIENWNNPETINLFLDNLKAAGMSLAKSLVKNNFNAEMNIELTTSLGLIKLNLNFKSEVGEEFKLPNSTDEIFEKKFLEEFLSLFIEKANLLVNIEVDKRFSNRILSLPNSKEFKQFLEQYGLDHNQEKFKVEIKNKKVFLDNKLIQDLTNH